MPKKAVYLDVVDILDILALLTRTSEELQKVYSPMFQKRAEKLAGIANRLREEMK